ncbi:hypothetical protein [Luteolibacter sp. AS25]|uniref:hypothetical protein n=1 Tax=Luteolibacter sp. AS25 TaxID=3135776 RepID=UPI00398A9819
MRVPLLAIIPLCLLTIIVIWWNGTRKMDFLTPPSEAKLEEIRAEALASLPVSQVIPEDAISVVVPAEDPTDSDEDPTVLVEPVDLGDTESAPSLDTYSNRAPDGADKLIRLAEALQDIGKFQRALLAYERVLDSSQGNPEQIQTALNAIQRIRPTLVIWNTEEPKEFTATINIGTGENFKEVLPEILDQLTSTISNSSSGIISFDYKLNIGKSIQAIDAPTPVAVWITGPDGTNTSTDVLSFTTDNPDSLEHDLLKTCFNLVRGELTKATSYNPAPEALDDPLVALQSHITRLLWKEFGEALNKVNTDQ